MEELIPPKKWPAAWPVAAGFGNRQDWHGMCDTRNVLAVTGGVFRLTTGSTTSHSHERTAT